MKHPKTHVTVSLLLGLLLIVGSHLQSPDGEWLRLLQEVAKDVGVACLLFGGFSAFLEVREIKRYFAERLEEIVIKQDYLQTLDLELMWTSLAVAKFKNPQLNQSDSFLLFIYGNLMDYLKLPYRERVGAHVIATRADDGGLMILDTVTYTCRAVNGDIDEVIGWAAGTTAFRAVHFIRASVTYPSGHPNAGHTEIVKETGPGVRALQFRLRKNHNFDGLGVTVEARYEIDPRNLQHWVQEQPCKGLAFIAEFPESYEIQFSSFVPTAKLEDFEVGPGSFSYTYTGWTMPANGCTWMLRKRIDSRE